MKCLLKYQDLEDNEDAVIKYLIVDGACRNPGVVLCPHWTTTYADTKQYKF